MGRASLTLFGTEWDKVIKSSVEDMSSNPKVSHRGDDESPYGEGYRLCRCNHLPIDWIVSVEVVENVVKKLIDALRDNPTPSSDFVTKTSFIFPNLFLEETNTFDNSISESDNFSLLILEED
ncbi:hypothetical protein Tco_0248027 [Tanacetum coccineum]